MDMVQENKTAEELVNESKSKLVELKIEIEKQKEMLENFKEQQQFLEDQLNQIQSIFVRQDIGVERNVGVPIFGRKEYRFNSLIGMEEQEFRDSTILVVTSEPNDETLRGYINNNNSLIPISIDKIRSCTLDIVLFNSVLSITSPNLVINLRFNVDRKQLLVSCTSLLEFKVLIYTTVNFDETTAAQLLRNHYSLSLKTCEQKIKQLFLDIDNTKTQIDSANRTVTSNSKRLTENKNILEIKENDLEKRITSYQKHLDVIIQQIENNITVAQKQSPGQAEEVTMVQRIGEILRDNNLETELTDLMHNYSNKLQEIINEYSDEKLKLIQLKD